MKNPAPSPSTDALLARAVLWLSGIAMALLALLDDSGPLGRFARRVARQGLRAQQKVLAAYLLVSAMQCLNLSSPAHAHQRPRHIPPGFARRLTRGGNLRRLMRAALRPIRRGDLRARINAMLALSAHPERAFGIIAKRWCKGLIRARLVAIAPPALRLPASFIAPTHALNTS